MKPFFDTVRAAYGPLSQDQVDGFVTLIDIGNGLSLEHVAYVLATAWHETARTMQPIAERGKRSYFDQYNAGTKKGRDLGNTLPGDGYKFRGRGYVQITGRRNYAKASKVTGVDLVNAPDGALDPAVAAKIIIDGMTRGWFTGKKMADYADYVSMRRVVNGKDKAALIAGYAQTFENGLRKAFKPSPKPQIAPPVSVPVQKPQEAPKSESVNPEPSVTMREAKASVNAAPPPKKSLWWSIAIALGLGSAGTSAVSAQADLSWQPALLLTALGILALGVCISIYLLTKGNKR